MKINIPSAIISTVFGVAFFAASSHYYYQPSMGELDHDLPALFTTDHAKARAAVSRLLINPASAEFRELRSVDVDAARYVCGNVKAKDKDGHYPGYRAFVYTVAIDFARIDDDGRIAQRHDAYRACPITEEKPAQQKLVISSDVQSMVKKVQKAIPPIDPANLSSILAGSPAGGDISSASTMEQQLHQFAGKTSPTGGSSSSGGSGSTGGAGSTGQQQANATFKAAPNNESEWRGDRPPAAWPAFPADHPLARPARKRTAGLALAMAKDVEDRWEQSKSGDASARPSSDEIKDACRALLTIDPTSAEFPKAWAAFVKLRKIDRGAAS